MDSQSQALVVVVENEARVDSRIVAKGMGLTHEYFIRTLRKYQKQLEELGIFRFENGKIDGRGRPETYVMLNKDQAIFAIQLSRNTEQVVAFKLALTQAFSEAEERLSQARSQKKPRKPKPVEPQAPVERLGTPPYFLSQPAGLLADEWKQYGKDGDVSLLQEALYEYLLYMNEPLSFAHIRECEALGLVSVSMLREALDDCIDFGNIEKVKTKYRIPNYLKPQNRAVVAYGY